MTTATVRGPARPELGRVPGIQLVLRDDHLITVLFFLPVPVFPAGWQQLTCLQNWWEPTGQSHGAPMGTHGALACFHSLFLPNKV